MTESKDYKRTFIEFMIDSEVLTFGDFVTKSGRKSPYFINTGLYRTGQQVRRLGQFYAQALAERFEGSKGGLGFDVLFGPAYKGIPLVVAASTALAEQGHDVSYCFNRKEVKDHGEGGVIVGHQLRDGDRVVIVEDITTAGTAVREVVPLLRQLADIDLIGLLVSVDRCERGPDDAGALGALAEEFSMATHAIVTVHEIMDHLDDPAQRQMIENYLKLYGAA